MDSRGGTEVSGCLPRTAIPKNYVLSLKPDLKKFTFEGQESIQVKITKESPVILLNAAELTVNEVEWEDGSSKNKTQKAKSFVLDEEEEILKINFEPALRVGDGALKIKFVGTLNDEMKGFYRSKYKGPKGEERYSAVTQFESTDARRCFPCWDEPAMKATFDATLIVPKDLVALSNMPVKSTTPYKADPTLQVVQFNTTPVMSSYLLAFCVGEYDYVEDRSSDGVLCRVYTLVGKKEEGRFALDITKRVLPYYKDYFGIAYPLPKLDLIAIADFSSGAMENWGLITYREACLLVDKNESTAAHKQQVALTVGHEIAHQWFGNLVTMKWWTHLWLNEGYASFVESMCVDHLFPEYDIWTQFITDSHNPALQLDSLNSSHPIEVPVMHPSEIEEIFDGISYHKGSAIIRMLHHFIGDKQFQKGMNIYLNRHKYGNTVTEDLWKALEDASSKPVARIMTTWTKQMGFPVIKILNVRQEGNKTMLSLSQEKFWANPSLQNIKNNYLWMVPLAFSKGTAPTKVLHTMLMDTKTLTITLDNVPSSDWVKVNPGIIGFYRVQYPEVILSQFLPSIRSKSMPPLDRLSLVDDLFALVESGQTPTVEVLSLLQAYVNEDNYTVWASISGIIGKLNRLLDYTNCHDAFKTFGQALFSTLYESVGWDKRKNEHHTATMLRSLVLGRMSSLNHQKTLQEGSNRFEKHVTGEALIPAELQTTVYKSALAIGNKETFKALLKLYRDADTQEEKYRISEAFGSIQDESAMRKALEFAISNDVRKQDTVTFIVAVGSTKQGRELAWAFFKEHHKLFQQRYPKDGTVATLVSNLAENFVAEEKALDVEAFFRDNSFYSTDRTVQQAVECIRLNAAWLKRDLASIQQYFLAKN